LAETIADATNLHWKPSTAAAAKARGTKLGNPK